jgi:hypothetical protein
MTQSIRTHELVQRFNEDETVWRSCERKRERRRLLASVSPLPEAVLDYLDELDAKLECRQIRAVGVMIPRWP